jgi:hypothetical protein
MQDLVAEYQQYQEATLEEDGEEAYEEEVSSLPVFCDSCNLQTLRMTRLLLRKSELESFTEANDCSGNS